MLGMLGLPCKFPLPPPPPLPTKNCTLLLLMGGCGLDGAGDVDDGRAAMRGFVGVDAGIVVIIDVDDGAVVVMGLGGSGGGPSMT